MNAPLSLAASQVYRISLICDFLENPHLLAAVAAAAPVSMPRATGSMGFDEPLWIGLGMVGLWAALDAYAERSDLSRSKCSVCRYPCSMSRFTNSDKLTPNECIALNELDDIRHLYAHNFSGQADACYFNIKRRRHVFTANVQCALSSGAVFDGSSLSLRPAHLRYYATLAGEALAKFS